MIFISTIVFFALILELIVVGWKRSSIQKITKFENTVKTDVFFLLLEVFNIYNLIAVVVSFGLCHLIARQIFEWTNFNLIVNIENAYLQFALVFIAGDLKNYVSHFFFHRYNSLWQLHEMHHSATDFCMLTRYRGHFLETAMKRFFDVIPYAILGAPIEYYFIIRVFSEFHQLVLHSSIESNWGWIGRNILVSPAAHKIHHSIKRDHYGKNFGNTFIIWDRIFGTYHPYEVVNEIGVPSGEYNKKGVLHDIYLGFFNFFTILGDDIKNAKKK